MPISHKNNDNGLVLAPVRWLGRHGIDQWSFRGEATDAWGMDRLGPGSGFDVRQVASHWVFTAPDGRCFDTVREMFRGFRLRICRCDREVDDLEQMRAVLTLIDADVHRTDQALLVANGFGGSRGFMEHYLRWLESEQFLDCTGTTVADVNLTAEARSVLRMLRATRPGSNIDCSARAVLERDQANNRRR